VNARNPKSKPFGPERSCHTKIQSARFRKEINLKAMSFYVFRGPNSECGLHRVRCSGIRFV
jgi:hypothetical protein